MLAKFFREYKWELIGGLTGVVVSAGVLLFALLALITQVKAAGPCAPAVVQAAIIAAERPAMGNLERDFWIRAIATAADKHKLPADVLTAKIAQESRFKGDAQSFKGAKGASQLMPMHVKGFDPFEIEINLDKGAEVLATELKSRGDIRKALRYYNGGTDALNMPMTAAYADAILARVYLATKAACAVKPVEKI